MTAGSTRVNASEGSSHSSPRIDGVRASVQAVGHRAQPLRINERLLIGGRSMAVGTGAFGDLLGEANRRIGLLRVGERRSVAGLASDVRETLSGGMASSTIRIVRLAMSLERGTGLRVLRPLPVGELLLVALLARVRAGVSRSLGSDRGQSLRVSVLELGHLAIGRERAIE